MKSLVRVAATPPVSLAAIPDCAPSTLGSVSTTDPDVSTDEVEGVPLDLVRHYAKLARSRAEGSEVDKGVWVVTVAGLEGAYGDGASFEEACDSLEEAVVGWVAVKRRVGAKDIPPLGGINLNAA